MRVRELIEPLEFDGGNTIVDDYLRGAAVVLRPRTHQRTVYPPGEVSQWDLWEPSELVSGGSRPAERRSRMGAAWKRLCGQLFRRVERGLTVAQQIEKDSVGVSFSVLFFGIR